jgi:hypothetical protein
MKLMAWGNAIILIICLSLTTEYQTHVCSMFQLTSLQTELGFRAYPLLVSLSFPSDGSACRVFVGDPPAIEIDMLSTYYSQ